MIIKDIFSLLQNSTSPIVKTLHQNAPHKTLAIGFKKDMVLKEHKTPLGGKIVVLQGSVLYKENEKTAILDQYDEHIIPPNVMHAVVAKEDALCLVLL